MSSLSSPPSTISIRGIDCFVHHWKASSSTTPPTPTTANDESPPKAVCVIFHGFLAHGGYPTVRYAAEFLSREASCAVVAVDFPGHGRSGGVRGYLPGADTLVSDGADMVKHARSLYPDQKLFLMGSSMGGAVALSVAHAMKQQQEKDVVAGVILLAPMLQLNVSPLERGFLRGLSYLTPSWTLIPSSATDDKKQYRDPQKRKECSEDELTVSGSKLCVASALSCVDLTHLIKHSFAKLECPLLLMIADEDVVVNNAGSEELYSRVASKDKVKKHYPALHGLLCEPSPLFDEIKKDMLDWIAQRI